MTSCRVDLLACFFTLGGQARFGIGNDESPWDFRDRVEAAGRAGYTGFGIKHDDLVKTLGRYSHSDMRKILDDNGLVHVEVEALLDWFATDTRRRASDIVRRDLLLAAEELGAHRLKATGDFGSPPAARDIMRSAFADLARQARDAGTTVALEPIPFGNVTDLDTALYIIGDTAGKGGGLMLDTWHVTRCPIALADIAALPGDWIAGVELDDGTRVTVGEPLADTIDRRKLCGEGEFDIAGFIKAIESTGFKGPWGVEILSEEHRARDLEEAATRSFETSAAQFR